jgi:O-antigen/teichoic acid export membrane protein
VRGAILRNTAWSTFAVIASPVLQFLFGGLTLRYVGVGATGFSLAVAAALGIAARIGTFGIGEAALPAIASALAGNDEQRGRRLIGAVLTIYFFTGLATAVVMLTFADSFVRWSQSPVETTTAVRFVAISCLTHVLGQMQAAVTMVLKAASRYDLVTVVTMPLSVIFGLSACALVPLFPSLTTIALLGVVSGTVGLLLSVAVASQAVPVLRRPLPGLTELVGLARYGFWLMLTQLLTILAAGVDDLVITGTCGAAAIPPWAIAKRFWMTAHTFLAQHVEHLIPTLGSMRDTASHALAKVSRIMHWYIMAFAAVTYTLMAWCGEAVVGVVAGGSVGELCRVPIFAFSMFGLCLALLIIPLTTALAQGFARPSFVVSLLSNSAHLLAVYGLGVVYGAPAVYYAPLASIPSLVFALGTTPTKLFDPFAAFSRLETVRVPLMMGFLGVTSSLAAPSGLGLWQRVALGGLLAVAALIGTIMVERSFGVNSSCHEQLAEVFSYALGVAKRSIAVLLARFQSGRTGSQH